MDKVRECVDCEAAGSVTVEHTVSIKLRRWNDWKLQITIKLLIKI